jgi:TonB family protein
MEPYLIYIGKAAVATAAFYLAYLVLFSNRKQFLFNRIYLPVMLALSLIIPLITFTAVNYVEAPMTDANSFAWLSTSSETVNKSESYSLWPHYLFGIYLLGVAGFFFHLVAGHIKAIQIIRGSRKKNLFDSTIYVTEKDVHPFSFFNRIVISKQTLYSRNLRMIVDHEYIHVKEKHTLDILFVEILFLLQWFNPFAWLIKDAVKNNLEFKTDDKIIRYHDPTSYQLAMVALAHKQGVAPFLTALNGSQLKNRIIMMKRENRNRFVLLKQLVMLPLVAVLVMGLSERQVKTEYLQNQSANNISQPEDMKEIFISGKVTNENGAPLANVAVIIKGKPVGTITDSSGNYKIKMEQEDAALIFTLQGYEKQEIETEGNNKIDIQLKPSAFEKSLQLNPGQPENSSKGVIPSYETENPNEPLYVVDGKVTKTINQVPPEDIERIEVLENQSATKLYGTDAKNGAILITTKSKSYSYLDDDAHIVRPQPKEKFVLPEVMPEFPGGTEALKQYIADNINYPESARENGIQGTVYVSFKITKEGEVTDVRLARGIHPPLDKEAVRVVDSMPDWKPGMSNGQPVDVSGMGIPVDFTIKDPVVKVKSYAQSLVIPGPLYIVDGEETRSIKEIDHDDIERIDVLNSASSSALYGQRGKDGVIIITTKQGGAKNKIITPLQLRRFIAERIKYPAEARQAGTHGVVTVVIDRDKNNQVIPAQNYASADVYDLDDVIVTGYGGKDIPLVSPEINNPLLQKEVERVLKLMPEIAIPTINKNLVRVKVEFKLQPEE